jgi:hypothetical protein
MFMRNVSTMWQRRLLRIIFTMNLLLALTLVGLSPAHAQNIPSATVYAVTTDNNLISFSSTDPGTIINNVAISGLPDGENLLAIDIRPANGQLYALGSSSRQYVINTSNGSATALGNAAFSTALSGTTFGFDFNPTVDRIRAVSDARQDLRLNPANGGVAAVDGALGYAAPDVNAAATPNIVASAYTNNFSGATTTTLFNIDADLDILVTQNPPNAGTLNTIGALGVDAGARTSFDIMTDSLGSEAGFAAINSGFYWINVASGEATLIGTIGNGVSVQGIAVAGSVAGGSNVPACADFNGSTSPIVGAAFPPGVVATGNVFCRVLVENRANVAANAGSQIGVQSVLDAGVIQAVDIFIQGGSGSANFSSPAKVCLLGEGRYLYLDATQTPRVPQDLSTSSENGYTCASIPNAGTVVLVSAS